VSFLASPEAQFITGARSPLVIRASSINIDILLLSGQSVRVFFSLLLERLVQIWIIFIGAGFC
jgi:hypothetical protein